MIFRSVPRTLALVGLGATMSCESGTDPEVQNPIDLVLDFCANEVPVWVAVRNQGAEWERLIPNAEGTVSFTATNDVILAFVRQNGGDYATEIVFAGNTDLEAISGISCREDGGTKIVNGTVSGVVAPRISELSMSTSRALLASAATSFSLGGVPDRPLDLVASTLNVAGLNLSADRIVIRRSQNPVHNATMPVIDFADPSALIPASFTATLSGVNAGEAAYIQSYFVSQLGTEHLLANVEPASNGNAVLVGVPAAALAAGDYHDVFAVAVEGSGLVRGVERFFTAPAAQALPLGTPLSSPTVSEAGTSPYLRLRLQLARNGDYARAINAVFLQQQDFSSTMVSMTVTQGYDGTGGWDVTMPDLSSVSGWQNAWGLVDGGEPVDWTVTGFGGRPELLFGAPPTVGETVRFASRSSSTNVAIAGAARRVSARLPRSAARSR